MSSYFYLDKSNQYMDNELMTQTHTAATVTARLQVRNLHGALRVVLAVGDRIQKTYPGEHANLTNAKVAIGHIKVLEGGSVV